MVQKNFCVFLRLLRDTFIKHIMSTIENKISQLYQSWKSESPEMVLPLKRTASGRSYFRVASKSGDSVIGTHGSDAAENKAFIAFSKHFHAKGLPVPEIFAEDLSEGIYLQEDLGGQTLYQLLPETESGFTENLKYLYKDILTSLGILQTKGGEGLDYSLCYPRADFDAQSMHWDLNYFKYFFLKLVGVGFDEQALENDFQTLINYLLKADCSHFMFRDFQSRNIMVVEGHPSFIDYQGGRRGALQYDVASLLYQPSAKMSEAIRTELLEHYLEVISGLIPVERKSFLEFYDGYVLIRRLQALGTYGFRGLHERYSHFLPSIQIALEHIDHVFENGKLPIDLQEIKRVIRAVKSSGQFDQAHDKKEKQLKVTVNSFSYKRAIPEDPSGNGGGFVFDCRFINNPGRHEPYKKLTGRDESVIAFLQEHSNIHDFLNNAYHLVDEAVEDYLRRDFAHLMVSFGCTGGQHRSVYSADNMARHLEEKYGVEVSLNHIEQELKGWVN